MKRIYLARDFSQAQLLVNMLEQAMIPARVENIHQAGGFGELAVTYPEIWVKRDQDEQRARQLIKEFETESKIIQQDKNCSNCNEQNPANFDWCWACQTELN